MKHNVVIRMGAANWDATINHKDTPVRFDFRTMTREERSAFHREFMTAFRTNYYGPQEQPKPTHQRRQRRRRYSSKKDAA